MDTTLTEVGRSNYSGGILWVVLGSEMISVMISLRWLVILVLVLVGADYYFAYRAIKKKGETFPISRSVRRSAIKFCDYIMLLLVGCVVGLAITEPWDLCDHVVTAGVCLGIGIFTELASILGHYFTLRGYKFEGSPLRILGQVLAALVGLKSPTIGKAVGEIVEKLPTTQQPSRDEESE